MYVKPISRRLAVGCLIAGAALAPLLSACEDNRDLDQPRRQDLSVQRRLSIDWDTLWTVGGAADDSLLLLPLDLAVDEQTVYVFDAGSKQVVALNLVDGTPRWSFGRGGGGPEEFAGVVALAALPEGGVVAADPLNRRLTLIGGSGQVLRVLPFQDYGYVQSVCALDDGSLLLTTLEPDEPLIRISRTGTVLNRYDLPWTSLASVEPLQRQVLAAADADHRHCTLALVQGGGFAVFDTEEGIQGVYEYVEPVETPEISVDHREEGGGSRTYSKLAHPTFAATDLAAGRERVYINFAGQSPLQGRLVDVYDLGTGRYRRSLAFPRRIQQIAHISDVLLLLYEVDGYPTLLAARPAVQDDSSATATALR